MNPFDSIGNFFGGLFGQKKKKDDERPRPQPTIKQPGSLIQGSKITQAPEQPLNLGGVRTPQPVKQKENRPSNLFDDITNFTKSANDATFGNVLKFGQSLPGAAENYAKGVGSVFAGKGSITDSAAKFATQRLPQVGYGAKETAQGVARAPEQLLRSVAGLLFAKEDQDLLTSNKVAGVSGSEWLAKLLYGDAPLNTYQKTSQDAQLSAEQSDNQMIRGIAPFAPFLAPLIAAGDATALGGATSGAAAAGKAIKPSVGQVVEDFKFKPVSADNLRQQGIREEEIATRGYDEVQMGLPQKPSPREPSSPITQSPTTNKPPVITSANPNSQPPTVQQPQPSFTVPQVAGNQPPVIQGVQMPETAMPQITQKVPTPDEATALAQQAIDDAVVQAPVQPPPIADTVFENPRAAEARVLAEQAAPVDPVVVQAAVDAKRVADAPTEAIANDAKLGTITRQSVLDGSINTPEGIDKAIGDVTTAATREAEGAGTTIGDIIRKGQKVWQESKARKDDLDTAEASALVKGFTPEQQAIYKAYAQEIGTLRDRSGLSLGGGNQGVWYGPRQSLTKDGVSAEFDPRLVNEIKRDKTVDPDDFDLDTSGTPYEQAIRRYANAPDASSQLMVNAVETKIVKGADGSEQVVPTNIKVPDAAKEKLEDSLTTISAKKDEALKLESEGDIKGAKKLKSEVQSDINKVFNDFIDDIPGGGKDRREAIANVKAMRGTYMQSTMQTLSLSNVVNRLADQGTRAVFGAQKPLVRGLEKVISPFMKGKAMEGTDALPLNTTKEARQAAKTFAKGTLVREVVDGFKANMSQAGAGRNPVVKGLAKLEALPRALSTGMTQLGDLSTQNVQKALQLGASRAEAAGLKTKAEYESYFADYVNSAGFKEDLTKVQSQNNPKIGLAGTKGDNMASGGKASNFLSREVDNVVSTNAKRAGIKQNRLIGEINDYVKGNLTGYAGVGSRVLGTVMNGVALGIPRIRKATKIAESGDPTAVASATQMAAQSVADAITTYGAGAATVGVVAASNGAIGFTGAQPTQGSSDSAYRKSNNVPANQWYLNIGDRRVYFDPARPLAGPGVAANVAGSISTGKDVASAAGNAASQVLNQAGGSSLPKTVVNIQDFLNPSTPPGSKDYASEQLQAQLAPSTGFINNIANWTDSAKRAPENFIDNLKSNIPILRSQTPEAKDSRGNTIENSKQLSGGSGLFSVGKNTDSAKVQSEDPVGAEINRLQKLDGSVFPTDLNKNATNKNTQTMSKLLIDNPLYKDADDKDKSEYMKSVLGGTSTKDINDSISDTDKSALLSAKLLGEKKTKVWLDNNDNSASYYAADYNNAKANKTLTSDDDNLDNKSGAKYKMIRAQVDKEIGADSALKQLYDDISETEWRAMANSESEDYDADTAGLLMAYDEARTKAGVSGKSSTSSKVKFALKTGKGSGKGRGRGSGSGAGGSDKFTFASLPASLVGNTAGSGSKGYADDAPLFKPIGDLRVPNRAETPNRRTISVKKGIQI